MSALFSDQRCAHGVSYSLRCAECLAIGLARASGERRHSCHVTYQIGGKACPMPTRQAEGACGGCWYFGDDHA